MAGRVQSGRTLVSAVPNNCSVCTAAVRAIAHLDTDDVVECSTACLLADAARSITAITLDVDGGCHTMGV